MHLHIIVNLLNKSDIQNYTHNLRLAEYFQRKEANGSEEIFFQNEFTFTFPRNKDRDLDHQGYVLNNLYPEKLETKLKGNLSNMEGNLSNMEQKELSKLTNDETIIIIPVDEG